MDRDEMIEILEAIIVDEDTNATAKCTAIRTLREIQKSQPKKDGRFAELDALAPSRLGRGNGKT